MDHQKQSNGFGTFLEHWGFLIVVAIASSFSWVLTLFTSLHGVAWISCFTGSILMMVSGSALIGLAKTQFRFGDRFWIIRIQSGPEHLIGQFRWGWRVFLCGALLAMLLLFF